MIRPAAVAVAGLLAATACAHSTDRPAVPPPVVPHVIASRPMLDAVASLPHLARLPDLAAPCGESTRRVLAWTDTRNGLTFVLAPAGTFTAGADPDDLGTFAFAERRTVVIAAPLLVCTTELTVGAARGVGLRRFVDETDDLPATRIDHDEALTICGLLGYDLPTEDEWEWAARGALPDAARCGVLPTPTTGTSLRPAGSGAPNALGLRDALGNAFEWCRDRTTVGGVTGFPVRGGAHDSESWRAHPARRDTVPDGMELAPTIGFRPVIRLAAPSGE